MIKIIEKPWGREEILELNDKYMLKRITMLKNCRCSLQYHNNKQETIYVLSGELNISQGLSANNVKILDPFTGTGTFIVRLIQLGLIPPDRLDYKYKNELHANEILMLAYYIAAVNIEMAYHSAKPDEIFSPFSGVVLTDTFNANNGRQKTFIFEEAS